MGALPGPLWSQTLAALPPPTPTSGWRTRQLTPTGEAPSTELERVPPPPPHPRQPSLLLPRLRQGLRLRQHPLRKLVSAGRLQITVAQPSPGTGSNGLPTAVRPGLQSYRIPAAL